MPPLTEHRKEPVGKEQVRKETHVVLCLDLPRPKFMDQIHLLPWHPGMLLVPGTRRGVDSLKMPVLFCPYSSPPSSPHLGRRPAMLCYLLIEWEFKLGRI